MPTSARCCSHCLERPLGLAHGAVDLLLRGAAADLHGADEAAPGVGAAAQLAGAPPVGANIVGHPYHPYVARLHFFTSAATWSRRPRLAARGAPLRRAGIARGCRALRSGAPPRASPLAGDARLRARAAFAWLTLRALGSRMRMQAGHVTPDLSYLTLPYLTLPYLRLEYMAIDDVCLSYLTLPFT